MDNHIGKKMYSFDSIEEWAETYGLTLEDALEDGVSQDDEGIIHIPDSVWAYIVSKEEASD